jgi:hypothetical protein
MNDAGDNLRQRLDEERTRRDWWQREVLDPLFVRWWRQTYGTDPPQREWREAQP